MLAMVVPEKDLALIAGKWIICLTPVGQVVWDTHPERIRNLKSLQRFQDIQMLTEEYPQQLGVK